MQVKRTPITTPEHSNRGRLAAQAVRPSNSPRSRTQGSAARIARGGKLVRVVRTVEQLESFHDAWNGMVRNEVQTDPGINVARTTLLGVSNGFIAGLRRFALLDARKHWWRRRRVRGARRNTAVCDVPR